MDRREWLTTVEVAEMLGFSDRWVRRQIELGRLPAHAFTGGSRRALRVRRSDLEAFRAGFFRDAME
jgi:excisionase family DNA binding protein